MSTDAAQLDLESLRPLLFRLVLVGKDNQRILFKARLVTLNSHLMLFQLPASLPESQALGGGLIEVSYADDNGLHSFVSHRVAMSARGGLSIQRPETIHTVQRRAHFRIRARIPGVATVQRADRPTFTFAFETQDLSAGGLRFNASTKLQADDDIGIALTLPDEGRINARARLVRAIARPDGMFTLGVSFERLPDAIESKIVRYLNQEQIRMRMRVEALVPSSRRRSP